MVQIAAKMTLKVVPSRAYPPQRKSGPLRYAAPRRSQSALKALEHGIAIGNEPADHQSAVIQAVGS